MCFVFNCAGFKFERIGPPQPAEMASIAADRVIETLRDVDKGVVPWFKGAAKTWLDEVGDPEEALALALAKITGEGKRRGLGGGAGGC
jgi:ATP-dependent RNA helicase DDX21